MKGWKYKGKAIKTIPEGAYGFVYEITNKVNGMKYIGKKFFVFKNDKKVAVKPTKAETTRLSNYELKGKTRLYKAYKSKLYNKYKGKKKKIKGFIDSDWKEYFGSSNSMQKDIDKYGHDKFDRKILRLCKDKFECAYYEMEEQVLRKVLFDSNYYNEQIRVRLHKKA